MMDSGAMTYIPSFIKTGSAIQKWYTRSLILAVERLRWDRDGIELRCKKKSNMARFRCTLSILLSRFFTFPLNHPVRGLANDSP
jgi:hypothetical protein